MADLNHFPGVSNTRVASFGARLAYRMAIAMALTTLILMLLGGLTMGIVMNDQVLGMKQELPRYVTEETRAVLGLDEPRFSFAERLLTSFMDLRIVEATQVGVEQRVVRTAFGPIALTYIGVVAAATTMSGFIGWGLGSRWQRAERDSHERGDTPARAAGIDSELLGESKEHTVTDYLPEPYKEFRRKYGDVADALDSLGNAIEGAGPLDSQTQRLVKLGIAIGAQAKGPVRSNVRRALQEGASEEAIRHVALLATTTAGYPTAIAALSLIDEVLSAP